MGFGTSLVVGRDVVAVDCDVSVSVPPFYAADFPPSGLLDP